MQNEIDVDFGKTEFERVAQEGERTVQISYLGEVLQFRTEADYMTVIPNRPVEEPTGVTWRKSKEQKGGGNVSTARDTRGF